VDGTKAALEVTIVGIGEATHGEGECQKCGREFVCILSLTRFIFCVEKFSPSVFSACKYVITRTRVSHLG